MFINALQAIINAYPKGGSIAVSRSAFFSAVAASKPTTKPTKRCAAGELGAGGDARAGAGAAAVREGEAGQARGRCRDGVDGLMG